MITRSILRIILSVAFTVLSGTVLCASTIYSSVLTIGQGTVDFSVTTDGATGVLESTDILSANITISDRLGSSQFSWPSQSPVSILEFQGSDLTATKASLSFNFSASDGGGLVFATVTYTLQAAPAFLSFSAGNGIEESAGGFHQRFGPVNQVSESGDIVIASVVPEPAPWALLPLSFLLLIMFKPDRALAVFIASPIIAGRLSSFIVRAAVNRLRAAGWAALDLPFMEGSWRETKLRWGPR